MNVCYVLPLDDSATVNVSTLCTHPVGSFVNYLATHHIGTPGGT